MRLEAELTCPLYRHRHETNHFNMYLLCVKNVGPAYHHPDLGAHTKMARKGAQRGSRDAQSLAEVVMHVLVLPYFANWTRSCDANTA